MGFSGVGRGCYSFNPPFSHTFRLGHSTCFFFSLYGGHVFSNVIKLHTRVQPVSGWTTDSDVLSFGFWPLKSRIIDDRINVNIVCDSNRRSTVQNLDLLRTSGLEETDNQVDTKCWACFWALWRFDTWLSKSMWLNDAFCYVPGYETTNEIDHKDRRYLATKSIQPKT